MHSLAESRWLKAVVVTLFFGTVALGLIGMFYVRFHYQAVMPRSPQPETGRLYPVEAQNWVVYVDKQEREFASFVQDVLPVFAFASGLLYVFLGMRLGWFKKKPPWDSPGSSAGGNDA